nr:MAG TPA: hypothetical protein [Caudoviricetes sp.]
MPTVYSYEHILSNFYGIYFVLFVIYFLNLKD